MPGRIPAVTAAKYPFVAQFPGVSVTELELRHGAMIDAQGKRTLVLLRGEGALASIPEATRNRDFLDDFGKQVEAWLWDAISDGRTPVQPPRAESFLENMSL